MTQSFQYRPRPVYEVESRIHQDREGSKLPKADEETLCITPGCSHPKKFHCTKVRANAEPRLLWVWNHSLPRLRFPTICKHFLDGQHALDRLPRCNSTACIVADCSCGKFQSPYARPRIKKLATGATGKMKREKATSAQIELELLDGV